MVVSSQTPARSRESFHCFPTSFTQSQPPSSPVKQHPQPEFLCQHHKNWFLRVYPKADGSVACAQIYLRFPVHTLSTPCFQACFYIERVVCCGQMQKYRLRQICDAVCTDLHTDAAHNASHVKQAPEGSVESPTVAGHNGKKNQHGKRCERKTAPFMTQSRRFGRQKVPSVRGKACFNDKYHRKLTTKLIELIVH